MSGLYFGVYEFEAGEIRIYQHIMVNQLDRVLSDRDMEPNNGESNGKEDEQVHGNWGLIELYGDFHKLGGRG